jgi:ATP-dependent HslUV protease ATP-binding subunit HslU
VNERTENIGARRLHTVLEKLLEDISFNAGDLAAKQQDNVLTLTAADVEQHLGALVQDEDLSRFIL